MPNPTVSIVVPLHNRADLVAETLRSALDQTFGDFELLVVDDASTDGGLDVVQGLGDPRVVGHRLERNVGVCEARNYGLDRARGEWVAFLDSDDLWLPKKLERQLAGVASRPEIGLISCWGREMVAENGETRLLGEWRALPDAALLKAYLLFNNPLPTSSMVVRRSLLETHALRFWDRTAEDYHLWTRLLAVSEPYVLPEDLVRVRVHPASMTARNPQKTLDDADEVRRGLLAKLGVPFSEEELALHGALARGEAPDSARLPAIRRWLHKLTVFGRHLPAPEARALRAVAGMWWLKACRLGEGPGWRRAATWAGGSLPEAARAPRHFLRTFLSLLRSSDR